MKVLGPNNDLRTKEGKIRKWGYLVLLISAVFGFGCFLAGRSLYRKILKTEVENCMMNAEWKE